MKTLFFVELRCVSLPLSLPFSFLSYFILFKLRMIDEIVCELQDLAGVISIDEEATVPLGLPAVS
jgi:hypothetical protein